MWQQLRASSFTNSCGLLAKRLSILFGKHGTNQGAKLLFCFFIQELGTYLLSDH